jgi:hypothetical protein
MRADMRLPVLAGRGRMYFVSTRVSGRPSCCGALTIRNGFTHHPQKQETYRFFKGETALPERIIMLDGSGSISFDVLAWLSEQRVSLIQINWKEKWLRSLRQMATLQIHFV